MKVQKVVTEDVNIDIQGITLLSIEEAMEIAKNDTMFMGLLGCKKGNWWLRSPGEGTNNVAYVDHELAMINSGGVNATNYFGVRPALQFNYSTSDLQIGDKVMIFGYIWTVVSEQLVLCDDIIEKMMFTQDVYGEDQNNYEKSDIKKWLDKWYTHMITCFIHIVGNSPYKYRFYS